MIRKAAVEDLKSVHAFICSYLSNERRELSTDENQAVYAQLSFGLERNEQDIYIAVDDSLECIGLISVHWIPFALIRGREGYISDLVVAKASRGAGIGSELLAAVETEAERKGCCRLMLNNHTGSEAYKREFYQKKGFQQRTDFANFVKRLDNPAI